jgi:very-short-patch-repair endonuclease
MDELVAITAAVPPKSRPVDAVVAELAYRQHGRVSWWQLRELGMTEHQIKWRARTGRLHHVAYGVYAVGHTRPSYATNWAEAVLACGPGALLSHWSAAERHALRRRSGRRIHVTVPGGGRLDHDGYVIHRVRRLEPEAAVIVDGIPTTSVARTCLDIAAIVGPGDTLGRLLEAAEDQRLLDLRAFEAVCGRGRAGSKALRRALALYEPVPAWSRSEWERRFYRELRTAGIRAPAVNLWIAGYEVDLVWLEERVIVELDSGYHDTPAARERDPVRDAALQAEGFAILRVRQRRFEQEPEAVMASLRRLLTRGLPSRP